MNGLVKSLGLYEIRNISYANINRPASSVYQQHVDQLNQDLEITSAPRSI